MNDHFPFFGFILLVTLFLDSSLQNVSCMFHRRNEDGKQSRACFLPTQTAHQHLGVHNRTDEEHARTNAHERKHTHTLRHTHTRFTP